jgi:hypothetical protein
MVNPAGVGGSGDVFARPVEMERGVRQDAVGEGWLTGKLMGKLLLFGHFGGMSPSCANQAVIHFERWQPGAGAIGIGQIQ